MLAIGAGDSEGGLVWWLSVYHDMYHLSLSMVLQSYSDSLLNYSTVCRILTRRRNQHGSHQEVWDGFYDRKISHHIAIQQGNLLSILEIGQVIVCEICIDIALSCSMVPRPFIPRVEYNVERSKRLLNSSILVLLAPPPKARSG